jgi:predicted RNA-binding Zn-ribbon protein involved in translation (DUF1610 family)
MTRRQTVLVALLIAVIAAAGAFAGLRVWNEIKGPSVGAEFKFEKIDMKSLEIFSETGNDWTTIYKADETGRFKNPKTGEYTMVNIMRCASCGQPIPMPELPAALMPQREPGKKINPRMGMQEIATAMQNVLRDYKCPKCGKNAWVPPAQPTRGKSK